MEITASAIQEVTRNNSVIFTDTPVSGNCSILHREGSSLVKLRGLTTSQCRARFKAYFNGNIAVAGGSAGEISLVITLDGEPIESTRMIVTPGAINAFFNVSSGIFIDVPAGCCATLGVRNTDGPAINVQNANFIVERVA